MCVCVHVCVCVCVCVCLQVEMKAPRYITLGTCVSFVCMLGEYGVRKCFVADVSIDSGSIRSFHWMGCV